MLKRRKKSSSSVDYLEAHAPALLKNPPPIIRDTLRFLEVVFLGAAFLGAAFLGAAFLGLAFLGLAFLGLAFLELAFLELAFLGLAFLELAFLFGENNGFMRDVN